MKIQPTLTRQTKTQKKQSKPAFGAYRNEVLKQLDPLCDKLFISHRNDTVCFRDNEFWQKLVDYASEKAKLWDSMNVYFYGCSIGAEPSTFLMQLFSTGSKDLISKIKRITAKDFDANVISMAKSGVLPLQGYEFEKIQKFTNGNSDKFLDLPKNLKFVDKETVQIPLNKNLHNKIDYSVADIITDYKNIEPKQSLVSTRNFLPYLRTRATVFNLIKNLGEHLQSGSNLAVGKFDHRGLASKRINLSELLEVAGFKQTKVENLYEKQ